MDFLTIEITSKKLSRSNVDFLTSEIKLKKVRGNNVEFSTIEITSKEVRGSNVDLSTIEIASKKIRGSNVDFLTSKIRSKIYVETTWKFVEIWFSTYRPNIVVKSTLINVFVPVGFDLNKNRGFV